MTGTFRTTTSAMALTLLGPVLGLGTIASANTATPGVDIPAQPMADAIAELADQTGLQVLVGEELLTGKTSSPAVGPMSPQQALARILEGSGLTLQRVSDASFALTPNIATQDAPVDLGTLVLRGELVERTLEESPTSAVIVTGEALEARPQQGLRDVIDRTPGVVAINEGFAIRGIPQNGVGFAGIGLTVSTQVDGVALPYRQATRRGPYATWDIDQVEVLRGPQSTQQGRNALAGAIIIRPSDPEFAQEFALRAEAGSNNHRRFALMANVPLVEDTVALRFTAEHEFDDGFIENTFLDENANETEATSFRTALRWAPINDLNVVLSHSRQSISDGPNFFLTFDEGYPSDLEIASEVSAFTDTQHDNTRLFARWDINSNVSLTSETNYYVFEDDVLEDIDYTPQRLFTRTFKRDATVFEQDLKLSFDLGALSGSVGAFYSKLEPDEFGSSEIDLGFFSGNPALAGLAGFEIYTNKTEVTNTAIFGEVDIAADALLPGLTFTLGARYDYEEQDDDRDVRYIQPIPLGLVDASRSGKTTFEAFLPKAGVSYDINDDHFVSLTYQRGYRSGGQQVDGFGGISAFDPEYTDNFELAYRGSFSEDRVRVSANLFHTNWTDQQVTAQRTRIIGAVPVVGNEIVNSGKSRLWGAELAVDGDVTENLSLNLGLAFVETEFTDFVDGANDFTGNQFAFAPSWTGQTGGVYRWDNGLTFSASASFTGARYTTPANDIELEEFWLVDTALTYEWESWVLGAYVNNLFDQEYLLSDFDEVRTGGRTVTVGDPRTFGVYAQVAF